MTGIDEVCVTRTLRPHLGGGLGPRGEFANVVSRALSEWTTSASYGRKASPSGHNSAKRSAHKLPFPPSVTARICNTPGLYHFTTTVRK